VCGGLTEFLSLCSNSVARFEASMPTSLFMTVTKSPTIAIVGCSTVVAIVLLVETPVKSQKGVGCLARGESLIERQGLMRWLVARAGFGERVGIGLTIL